ncbi:hypothetical protein [Pseudobutyrivibrio xylanivorans]|uniref:Uncharacterized protein n=1 Tax=Pseudobutyrivibrio xylanivorans TaxID=185007 RepID=A0A5P6VTW8_PSEXY|nr:hypothetical protein [Pseudobutyrivibrio xylanivorans]QFJ55199.1 hypothetical protein FXF36_10160 [Pseudobutyrivibrio xylanivorans]
MKKKKLWIIIGVVLALAILTKVELEFNPSFRVLASVVDFSESTLNSPDYLAYNIDLKDLFRNYTNADIRYSGSAYIKKLKGFPYSISGSIKGERSCEQRKFSCKSDLNVLVLNVGEMEAYADNETVYLVAPLLGDISYGFNTGENLFLKAPDLNNDINQEWFHNNKRNIFNFVRNIGIEKTEEKYIDDGTECSEFKLTIPQGQGDFIWELLGTDAPDHDITCFMYLDKRNHTHKITFDLSHKTKGAYISIFGKNFSTMEIYAPLPDEEKVVATIKRNGNTNYTNSFTDNITYTTNKGKVFSIDTNVLLNYVDDGIKIEATDFSVTEDNVVLAQGYLKGRIKKVDDMGDVFKNAGVDLSNVTVIDWDTIKNDTASFVDDVISQARKNVDLFNFFD